MSDRRYFVYIMTSQSRSTMYIGVTNDIGRRVFEHRNGMGSEFAKKYRVNRLVYVEEYEDPSDAIAREKQLKGWKRIRKNELVRAANPDWEDLAPSLRAISLPEAQKLGCTDEVLRCAQTTEMPTRRLLPGTAGGHRSPAARPNVVSWPTCSLPGRRLYRPPSCRGFCPPPTANVRGTVNRGCAMA